MEKPHRSFESDPSSHAHEWEFWQIRFTRPASSCTETDWSPRTLCDISQLFSTNRHFSRFFELVPLVHRHDDFPRLATIVAAHDSILGHPVDQTSATSITDPQRTLQQ